VTTLPVRKFGDFGNDVIFVDGNWGSGKAILTSLLACFEGVEKKKVEHIYEYLCVLHHLGRIQEDAAVALLRIYADLSQYNNRIGREINLRWTDDSGLRNSPGALDYVRRLRRRDGEHVVAEIRDGNLALNVATHETLPVADLLHRAFGARLRVIEMVRHPVHQYANTRDYLATFERDREFTIAVDRDGVKVPWFAADWAADFAAATVPDRALLSIARFKRWKFAHLDAHAGRYPLLVVAFEEVVRDPRPTLARMRAFLGRDTNGRLERELRRQRLPRTTIAAGRATSSFSFVGRRGADDETIYRETMATIARECGASARAEFAVAVAEYDRRYPSPLAAFAVR
jgi:hypothetical protein